MIQNLTLLDINMPQADSFEVFGVNEEDIQHIRVLLHQTSVQNKEISVQIKAKVENDSQMYSLKLHTLRSYFMSSIIRYRNSYTFQMIRRQPL